MKEYNNSAISAWTPIYGKASSALLTIINWSHLCQYVKHAIHHSMEKHASHAALNIKQTIINQILHLYWPAKLNGEQKTLLLAGFIHKIIELGKKLLEELYQMIYLIGCFLCSVESALVALPVFLQNRFTWIILFLYRLAGRISTITFNYFAHHVIVVSVIETQLTLCKAEDFYFNQAPA